MRKRILSVVLAVLLLCTLLPAASAANVSAQEAIDTLTALGLVRGTGAGFEPDQALTRTQAAVMLVRLLGCEATAQEAGLDSGFSDVPAWAEASVGWARAQGLLAGRSGSWFGAGENAQVRDYLTFVLRALGYIEGEDFRWSEAVAFADRLGLTHGEYTANAGLLREDMALISYTALTLNIKDSQTTLVERLYQEGVISYGALTSTRLAGCVNVGKQTLTARELYEKASSSVFYLEVYDKKEDAASGIAGGTGSGFFISADGLAVMTYHELEGRSYAVATTNDGRRYELERVLYYDPMWDIALVRISRTDLAGGSVRFFPYLELGDSNAVSNGDTVYTLSSPQGLQDSISSGIVSNRSRNVDDPSYPCIQFTAPISQGSSGGALLNEYGEVIGVVFALYASGQNLNLAVPVNCLEEVSRTAEGETLEAVRATEDARKAAAMLSVSKTHLTLREGELEKVMVTHTAPSTASILYVMDQSGVVTCTWGGFETKQSVPLYITAVAEGTCTLKIAFAGEGLNPDAVATIEITVLPEPERNGAA